MNPSITVTEISDFFERLDQFKQAEAEGFIARFTAFRPKYEDAREAAEIATRQFAPKFNIFRFFGGERFEKFHSDFISYLLNPHAGHAQGHLFLQTFFKSLQDQHVAPNNLPDISHGSWLVEREVVTRDGNLDIVLRNPSLKILYVIENKVDAGEQHNQLCRYATYLERQKEDYPYRGLLFLTLNGRRSETDGGKEYHPISYHIHIHHWLEHTLPKIEAATVRETVRQYLSLIQDL